VNNRSKKINGVTSLGESHNLALNRRALPVPNPVVTTYHQTKHGAIYLGDSLDVMAKIIKPKTVDLIMTSPPFGLVRKKDYGNADSHEYLDWFRPFGEAFKRVLKDSGSLVIDIGGAWIPGQPTRSLYHYELLIMLCKELGFHLAQDFFWWSPSKLPTPAEWGFCGGRNSL
jgi:site-specific DNA-methyltransferase (cytosine-N4-specific)